MGCYHTQLGSEAYEERLGAWYQGFCGSQKERRPEGEDENRALVVVVGISSTIHREGWKNKVTKALRVLRSCGIIGSSEGKVGEEGIGGHNSPVGPKETTDCNSKDRGT